MPAAGTALQCKALAATKDPSMMELLRSINACHKGNYKDIPIIIKKAVTVCDVITLDRAVRKNVVSVVYFVQRIDPAETDADSKKLRKLLDKLEQRARSKYPKMNVDEGSLNRLLSAPFRQRPLPKLLTAFQSMALVVAEGDGTSISGLIEVQTKEPMVKSGDNSLSGLFSAELTTPVHETVDNSIAGSISVTIFN